MLIDGHFFGGECDQTFSRSVLKSPYSGSVVGAAAEGGSAELEMAVDAADTAFKSWRSSSRADRQELLRRISRLVREQKEELSSLLVDEIGKPITMALAEVERLALTFDYSADLLSAYGMEAIPVDMDRRGIGYVAISERFPIGPVLCMAPYNWPLNLVAHKIGPIIATGNSAIVKTSPLGPLSTMRLGRLIHEAGCPPGLINIWNGSEKHVANALSDSRIKMLSFTGSAKVGWMLKGQVPGKPVLLELGGAAFAIVEPDADQDWAVKRIVSGAYGYAGQVCISVQHALVHEEIYDEFRSKLIQASLDCPTGDPAKSKTVCGPLIDKTAVDRVVRMVNEAVSLGSNRLVEGKIDGNVVHPTLLEDVPLEAELMREEVFGPVLTLSKYREIDETVDIVNRSKYGIQTGLFTQNLRTVDRAYRSIETGGLIVNDYPTLRFDNVPYGGVKMSGFGREGVRYAMDEMTQPKLLLTRTL